MPLYPPAGGGGGALVVYTKTLETEHAANLTGNGAFQVIAAIAVPAGTYQAIGLAQLEDSTALASNLNIFAINTQWGVTGDDTDSFAETTSYSGNGDGAIDNAPIVLISGDIVLADPATLYFIWLGAEAVSGVPLVNQYGYHEFPSTQLILLKTA